MDQAGKLLPGPELDPESRRRRSPASRPGWRPPQATTRSRLRTNGGSTIPRGRQGERPETLARYPALEAASEPYEDPETNERALRLGGTAGPAVGSARVAAIAFSAGLPIPSRSSVRPLAAGQAATELWRCTLSAEAWPSPASLPLSAVSPRSRESAVPRSRSMVRSPDPGGIAEGDRRPRVGGGIVRAERVRDLRRRRCRR